MNATLTATLESLRDIRCLDAVPWWPLAPGWWVVIAVLVALLLIGGVIAVWMAVLRRDWRNAARHELHELGLRIHQACAKEVAATTAELLRRIAMVRHGRTACAGLIGEAWLRWLTEHDPAGFPWLERGRILLALPYAPPRDQAYATGTTPDELRALVEAILPWLEPQESWTTSSKNWVQKTGKSAMEWITLQRVRYFHV